MINGNVKVDELKKFIAGREIELAKQLGIVVDGIGKEHKQYCPFCRGTSGRRFYIRTGEKTTFHCRQKCFKGGDIFTLYMAAHNVGFQTAKQQIADTAGYVAGVSHFSQAPAVTDKNVHNPVPSLDTFPLNADSPIYKATAAHRPDILFEDYQRAGAKLYHFQKDDWTEKGIAIPMFDCASVLSGWVRYTTGGKKKISEGAKSGIVGIDAIYNLRIAKQAKIVFKTAGVSDYLILSGRIAALGLENDYYAFTNGAGENELPGKFDALLIPALTGQVVRVIQDNDSPGEAGALRWAEHFAEYAADVRIVGLPPVIFDCDVKDLRDFFNTDGTAFEDLLFL
jgi:hypothetical protein